MFLTYKSNTCNKYAVSSASLPSPLLLSSGNYVNPLTNTTRVILYGDHLRNDYFLRFGSVHITYTFISSQQIEFTVPSYYTSGMYPIQMNNGYQDSNILYYTVE